MVNYITLKEEREREREKGDVKLNLFKNFLRGRTSFFPGMKNNEATQNGESKKIRKAVVVVVVVVVVD